MLVPAKARRRRVVVLVPAKARGKPVPVAGSSNRQEPATALRAELAQAAEAIMLATDKSRAAAVAAEEVLTLSAAHPEAEAGTQQEPAVPAVPPAWAAEEAAGAGAVAAAGGGGSKP